MPITLNCLTQYEYGIWLTINSVLVWIDSFDIGLGNGLRNQLTKSIAELVEEGIKAEPSRKGRDSVNHGIQLIQNYEIIVHDRNCPEFKKEIQNYCYETDKDGKPTNKPDHEFSHGMDAMRYATGKVLVGDTFSFD